MATCAVRSPPYTSRALSPLSLALVCRVYCWDRSTVSGRKANTWYLAVSARGHISEGEQPRTCCRSPLEGKENTVPRENNGLLLSSPLEGKENAVPREKQIRCAVFGCFCSRSLVSEGAQLGLLSPLEGQFRGKASFFALSGRGTFIGYAWFLFLPIYFITVIHKHSYYSLFTEYPEITVTPFST